MTIQTEGTEDNAQPANTGDQTRKHVEENELANGGLDLPVGAPKDDQVEAKREEHKEWHPDTGNTGTPGTGDGTNTTSSQ